MVMRRWWVKRRGARRGEAHTGRTQADGRGIAREPEVAAVAVVVKAGRQAAAGGSAKNKAAS